MGLTAHDMSDMGRLAQLAMNPRDGASREEIYLAVASLYRIQGTGLNNRERELMREILRRLTRDVEMAIRIALAERLADDASAPHDLILLLVDDSIEVARPLILRSPLLTEKDTLRLVAEAGVVLKRAQEAAEESVCLHLLQVKTPVISPASALEATSESANTEAIKNLFIQTSSDFCRTDAALEPLYGKCN